MDYMRIGQEVVFKEALEVKAALSGTEKTIKVGDRGIVKRRIREGEADIEITTGEARGKRIILLGNISEDVDTTAIAGRLATRINREFMGDDEDMQPYLKDIIEATLEDYL